MSLEFNLAFLMEFDRDKSVDRYENDYVILERDENGRTVMTGKPLRDVFIYEKDECK